MDLGSLPYSTFAWPKFTISMKQRPRRNLTRRRLCKKRVEDQIDPTPTKAKVAKDEGEADVKG
jgi:hypothetical protein